MLIEEKKNIKIKGKDALDCSSNYTTLYRAIKVSSTCILRKIEKKKIIDPYKTIDPYI